MRKLYTYFNGSGSPVEDFLAEAPTKVKDKCRFQLPFITDDSMAFREPYVKHFSIEKYKRLYEIRAKAGGVMVRVIFYEHDGEVVLLHAFYKKGKKDTEKALDYALKLLNKSCDVHGRVKAECRKELVL